MSFTKFLLDQFQSQQKLHSLIVDAISEGSEMFCCGISPDLGSARLELPYKPSTATFIVPFEAEAGANGFENIDASGEIKVHVKFSHYGRKLNFEITSYEVFHDMHQAA